MIKSKGLDLGIAQIALHAAQRSPMYMSLLSNRLDGCCLMDVAVDTSGEESSGGAG